MGKISLENLVANVEGQMANAQLEAREKISVAVQRAKKEDPLFFF